MWNEVFPEQASTLAGDVDRIFRSVTVLSLFFAVPVAVLIIVFAIKYRRGVVAERITDVHEGREPGPTWLLEASWIGMLFFLGMGVFGWGARIYFTMNEMPARGMDVYVVGKQWMWKFQHPTGHTEIDELHVPVNFPVRLTMISEDVIHSFYVPAFRIKQDLLPGMYTTAWFEATQTGEYELFCAEYCGTYHSRMLGRIVVMEPVQYQQWLSQREIGGRTDPIPEDMAGVQVESEAAAPVTMASAGEELFQALGCRSCHPMDDSGAGPSLVGRWGKEVALESGQEEVFDIQYVRQSILDPLSAIHAGYAPIMPSYEGQIGEEELLQLIEYVRSLSEEEQE